MAIYKNSSGLINTSNGLGTSSNCCCEVGYCCWQGTCYPYDVNTGVTCEACIDVGGECHSEDPNTVDCVTLCLCIPDGNGTGGFINGNGCHVSGFGLGFL